MIVVLLPLSNFVAKAGDGVVGVLFEGEQGGYLSHFIVKIIDLNFFRLDFRITC